MVVEVGCSSISIFGSLPEQSFIIAQEWCTLHLRLMFENEGWLVGFDERVKWAEPSTHEWHHYHVPTVEDVLREFICDHEEGIRDEVDLITEYAAKLRLAEEDA